MLANSVDPDGSFQDLQCLPFSCFFRVERIHQGDQLPKILTGPGRINSVPNPAV